MGQVQTLHQYFFFNDTATTEIYTLSLHDALPISTWSGGCANTSRRRRGARSSTCGRTRPACVRRSEEHTSELQSRLHIVCRLLLEKKKLQLYFLPPSGSCSIHMLSHLSRISPTLF